MDRDMAMSLLFTLAVAKRERAEMLRSLAGETEDSRGPSFKLRAELISEQADAID